MTPDELERASSLPAASVGVDVEPALATDLVAGLSARPAALPLLQFSLTELFDRRVSNTMLLSTHRELGGLTGALAARADRILAAGGPDDEPEVRRIFGRLVTFGEGTEDTRRRALRSEFGDGERTARLLDAYVTARLLTTDRDPATREPTIEVAHEALLRDWPRLRRWLGEDRDLRRIVGTIGVAATAWDRGGRQASDLYRGGRLDSALDVADANADWLRPADHEFLEASREQDDADRSLERRRVRRLRRLVIGTAAALVIALIAGGVAFTQQRVAEEAAAEADRQSEVAEVRAEEADEQRRSAEDQAEIADAATTDSELAELIARSAAAAADRPEQALLLALEAHRRAPGPPTISALLDATAGGRLGRQVAGIPRLPDNNCIGLVEQRRISVDGHWEFATIGTDLLLKNLVSGQVTIHGTAPAKCAGWFEDRDTGLRWATSNSLSEQWTGSSEGPWTQVELGRRGGALLSELVEGRLLFGQDAPGLGRGNEVVVVDAASLEPVAPAIPDLVFDLDDPFPSTAASRDEGLFAVGNDGPDGGGLLVVLDADTGTEVFRVTLPGRVTAVAFGGDGRTLLAGGEGGTIATVDLVSGAVVDDVSMSEPLEIIALGTRPDNVIVAVSRRSIELLQPLGGRLEAPIGIPDAEEARVRPDGTVLIVPSGDTDALQVIDPNRGPLVEQGWDVDDTSLVGFGVGRAGVVTPSGSAQIVELGSGSRTDLELTMSDGEPFDAVAMIPEADGHLAWNDGTLLARWSGGEVVEQLELWSGRHNVTMARYDGRVRAESGAGFAGAGAMVVFEFTDRPAAFGSAGPLAVYGFDPTPGNLAMVSTIDTPPFPATAVAPAPEDGLYVVLDDGMLRTYDRAGDRVQQIGTGFHNSSFAITDPTTGSVALGGDNGAVIVNPSTESIQSVTDVAAVVSFGFARNGTLLVVVESDGTVRLWDTLRAELVGTLWTGNGTAPPSPPWYDESTDSVWVATSGKILQFSLEPTRWIERACALVARELTPDEWERLVPGETEQRSACN